MNGKMIIVSAPSGAGKSTICNFLLESDLGLEFSISATTRDKRGKERDGVEYYFMTPHEFNSRIDNDEFVEWEEVYKGHRYGTLKSEMERIWSKGRHVLFDVDANGGINLKKIFGENALSIFIMPPSIDDLEKRLNIRGLDSHSTISTRVAKAQEELELAHNFDMIIVNDSLDHARLEAIKAAGDFLAKP